MDIGSVLMDTDLARLSAAIYERDHAAQQPLLPAGWAVAERFEHADSEALLALRADGHAAALVFRGTEASEWSLSDVNANIGFGVRWAGVGRVHSGYRTYLERVRDPARRMAEHVSASIQLFATGHSMGGALASLYASWVGADRKYGHRLAGLVTMGAPKCMSSEAWMAIQCPIRRHVITGDFAPYWPPLMFGGAPGEITHPAPTWYHGPLRRHGAEQYALAIAAVAK